MRYLFLTRRQTYWGLATLAAWALFLVSTAAILPRVVDEQLARREYRAERAERAALGDRLKQHVERLESLHSSSDEVRVEMSKIYLAYGFTESESQGQGGYPYEPESVPDSIYAESIRRGNGLMARVAEQYAVLDTFLGEVQAFEEEHADQVETTPSISPVRSADFVLTSPFGSRTSPFTKKLDFHAGVDMAAQIGTPIYAPASGVVAFAGRYPLKQSVGWWRYGNMVALRHGDRFITLYGHLDEVKVQGSQKVEQGELIGTVGDTGWSTNPHLHYEIRRREGDNEYVPVDPRIYMLDHTWRGEEMLLVRARRAPEATDFDPLPSILR